MEPTVLKIAMAGLLHDIGKFAQGCLEVTPEYLNNNANYQPFNKKNGRHTHIHAVYTAAFIEQFADQLPPQFNMGGWGDGDSFLNLAAGHHNPQTPMQWIIATADRVSSGFDRDSFDQGENIKISEFKQTRLLPLLESLTVDSEQQKKYADSTNFHFRYPLARLSPETIFPVKKPSLSKGEASAEYQQLFSDFSFELASLLHRIEAPEVWCKHFDSLLLLYTSAIPAARVGDVVHDVSLYDHCRTTAALATALYLYHHQNDSLDELSIRDNKAEKFLLISGDFYGIQDFIFSQGGEKGKYRAKLLRGRSFQVSLFSELAADRLCHAIGLPETSVILNAAGKFTILAPCTEKTEKALSEVEEEINRWLFDTSCGQCGIGFSSVKASPADFISGRFAMLWDQLNEAMAEKKLHRIDLDIYGGVVPNYLEKFHNKSKVCSLCGRRPAEEAVDFLTESEGSSCAVCRDQVFLGASLVKNDYLAICHKLSPSLSKRDVLLRPLFEEYHIIFPEGPLLEEASRGELISYWNLGSVIYRGGKLDSSVRFLGGYVPIYPESSREKRQVMDFGEIAAMALVKDSRKSSEGVAGKTTGTEVLGVFKADIDNLGILLGCGMTEQWFTLSRMATLSRQLNNFFTIYLPSFLEREEAYRGVYTVFAGGDDLFLIGPWNRIIELAEVLRKSFAEYVCFNSELHFSAGITLHKPHTPIDKLAREAEAGLEKAKHFDEAKNRLTLFGETVTWETLAQLDDIRVQFASWLEQKVINKALLYRLAKLCILAARAKQEEARLKRGEKVDLSALTSLKWRSQLCYMLERNVAKDLTRDERKKALAELVVVAQWLDEYGSAMKIPLWRILYDLR
ncbi:MAG: type III-A CRISPR-associated protein Cas10/Csm1 [Deltaproteobacteria bacterium]|nr:type III-A CRISPR-associated protein Cas10/Csm1 [Candidatus Tharpella aukensis]